MTGSSDSYLSHVYTQYISQDDKRTKDNPLSPMCPFLRFYCIVTSGTVDSGHQWEPTLSLIMHLSMLLYLTWGTQGQSVTTSV